MHILHSLGSISARHHICKRTLAHLTTLKRRLSSGKRWKIICEHYSFLLCKCGRTSVKTCSLKSMALQMPSYSKYACNIVNIGGPAFTPRVRVVPSFCASVCNITKTWPNFLSFWWFQNLAIHTNSYMLDDQPFLVGSTPFLSQCNRMTRTQLHL